MYPIVVVKQPNRKPLYVQVTDAVEVGRECDGLLLADPQTSRRHVVLDLAGSDVTVADLGSTNGTFVDDRRITEPNVLQLGSVARVGDTTIELVPAFVPEPASEPDGTHPNATVVAELDEHGEPRRRRRREPGVRESSILAVARAVRDTNPHLGDYEGTITIVFSDIESSTERATSMGDTAWMRVLNHHNEIVRRSVSRWGGREVKNQGDGFMLTFPGARRALQAMVAVQRELAEMEERHDEEAVRIRIGVHTGEVISEGGDIFGRHVMMAARVAGTAQGGEILVSSLVREIASARGDLDFGAPRSVTLKGIDGDHVVYPLRWR